MARRRRRGGQSRVQLPWQIILGIGFILFAVMRWAVPSLFAGSPILAGLATVSRTVAWLPLIAFGLLALIAFSRVQRPAPVFTSGRDSARSSEGPIPGFGKCAATVKPADDSIPGFGASASNLEKFDGWSLAALRQLEWKRFELLCASYYNAVGFRSQTLRCGADGGIDVKLFKGDSSEPLGVVQCKAWNARPVGVKEIRELLGVMAHEKVRRGIFITTSTYTADAAVFGAANPILLLDGAGFIGKILALPKERQDALLREAFDGDYRTPTCPSCGVKTVRRESKRGAFWGCPNYPRCRTVFNAARA